MELFNNPTLNEIIEQLEKIVEVDGVFVDVETGEAINGAAWAGLKGTRDEKVRAYIAVIKDLRMRIKMHDEEVERQKKRKEQLKKKSIWLFTNLERALKGEAFESVEGKVSYRMTPGRVQIIDEGKIPEKWMREPMKPPFNVEAMRKYMRNGGEIPGAELVKERKMSIE